MKLLTIRPFKLAIVSTFIQDGERYCMYPGCIAKPRPHFLVALEMNKKVIGAYLPVCEEHMDWAEKELNVEEIKS